LDSQLTSKFAIPLLQLLDLQLNIKIILFEKTIPSFITPQVKKQETGEHQRKNEARAR
jgi:hypothetical protein